MANMLTNISSTFFYSNKRYVACLGFDIYERIKNTPNL